MGGKVGKEKMEKIHLLKGCTFQRFISGGVGSVQEGLSFQGSEIL